MIEGKLVKITGIVTQVIHLKKDFGDFGISYLRLTAGEDLPLGAEIKILGPIRAFAEEESVELLGLWEPDPRPAGRCGAEQFRVKTVFRSTPQTLRHWCEYLARNIDGVGEKLAARIVEYFGLEIETRLRDQPAALLQVKGMSPRKAERFLKSWDEDRLHRSLGLLLAEMGLPDAIGAKVLEHFGAAAVRIVQDFPYRLIEIPLIGFRTADEIALARPGFTLAHPDRVKAALLFTMEEQARQGHTVVVRDKLVNLTVKNCRVVRKQAISTIEDLLYPPNDTPPRLRREWVPVQDDQPLTEYIYLCRLYRAEAGVAEEIRRLFDSPFSRYVRPEVITGAIAQAEAALGCPPLDPDQRQAVLQALTTPFSLLLGAAGTGKTSTLRVLVWIAKHVLRLNTFLCAPTGRARKRMCEVIGEEARTIHKTLVPQPDPGGFFHKRENPLACQLLVVDEMSMVDIELASHLLAAVPADCTVLLVGDEHQLPSVGPGKVLLDLIYSQRIPLTRLTKVHRQGPGSLGLENAHRILRGEMPVWQAIDPRNPQFDVDDYFLAAPTIPEGPDAGKVDPARLRGQLQVLIRRIGDLLPDFDPKRDLQILSLQKDGEVGMYALNRYLQEIVNPQPEENVFRVGQKEFRLEDRLMVVNNNDDLNIANGDIGQEIAFDREESELRVDFYGEEVTLGKKEMQQLQHAYSITVHKGIGSQFPVTILLMFREHHRLLYRQLFYTAATRFQRLKFTIGQRDAIERAVKTTQVLERKSLLALRLFHALAPFPTSTQKEDLTLASV